ncbi:hypothetical protein GCM10009682_57870 [Luedemannella flava]|uniref:Uncharacterized protein n=1 Tax=Luedemannella flava TaxID=349316 RepID=A0ABN2MMQ0_9ACTN
MPIISLPWDGPVPHDGKREIPPRPERRERARRAFERRARRLAAATRFDCLGAQQTEKIRMSRVFLAPVG